MSELLNDDHKDLGTKECPHCEGKKRLVAYCYCKFPCNSCDEFEYIDCITCLGEGVVAKTDEDQQDDFENAMEATREAANDN